MESVFPGYEDRQQNLGQSTTPDGVAMGYSIIVNSHRDGAKLKTCSSRNMSCVFLLRVALTQNHLQIHYVRVISTSTLPTHVITGKVPFAGGEHTSRI